MTNPFDTAVVDLATERLAELNANPVDGNQLLQDISSFIARYLHCSENQRVILAAWVVHTYCHSAAQFTPYLAIQSAEKQSGKTRCLLLLHLLCDYPALIPGFTPSSLFRLMKSGVDTLLLDECQANVGTRNRSKAPVLRAILAAGAHAESSRLAAPDRNRFCPKAFAGRGPLPEDLADLSIPIILEPLKAENARVAQSRVAPPPPAVFASPTGMTANRDVKENAEGVFPSSELSRRAVDHQIDGHQQTIERLHLPTATEQAKPLHSRLRIWSRQNLDYLKEGPAYNYECFPPSLTSRRQDIVEPLLQIADLSGGEWPQRIREALVEVFVEQIKFDLYPNIQLLADIRDCFAHHGNPDRLSTEDLLAWILALEARPWDIDGPLNGHKLAPLLRPFGIHPKNQRIGKSDPKRGYELKDFQGPWKEYLNPGLPKSEIVNKACPRLPRLDVGGELASPRDAGCNTVSLVDKVSIAEAVGAEANSLSLVPCALSPEVNTVSLVQVRVAQPPGSPAPASFGVARDGAEVSSAVGQSIQSTPSTPSASQPPAKAKPEPSVAQKQNRSEGKQSSKKSRSIKAASKAKLAAVRSSRNTVNEGVSPPSESPASRGPLGGRERTESSQKLEAQTSKITNRDAVGSGVSLAQAENLPAQTQNHAGKNENQPTAKSALVPANSAQAATFSLPIDYLIPEADLGLYNGTPYQRTGDVFDDRFLIAFGLKR